MSENFIKGLVEIVGNPDSGKSSAAIEYYQGSPENIAFIDNDIKGESTAEQMKNDGFPFGFYFDLRDYVVKEKWYDYYSVVENTIEKIKNHSPKIVIWDTWPDVYKACLARVTKHPEIYNELYGGKWSANSNIRNGEHAREARRLEGWLISEILKFADTFIITSHLKSHYLKNPKTGQGEATGKQIPQSSMEIVTLARLRLWLSRSVESKVPMALVLKHIDRKKYVEKVGMRTLQILPFKVIPNVRLPEEDVSFIPSDVSIWDTIRRYWNNPVGTRDLMPCEIPTEEEQSIIDGTLTREQRIMWLSAIKSSEEQSKLETEILETENKARAIELREEGLNASEILQKLNENSEAKITLTNVINWIK